MERARDPAASAVAAALERWGANARFFDQNDALEAGLEFSVGSGVKGRLQLPDGDINSRKSRERTFVRMKRAACKRSPARRTMRGRGRLL